jgi:Bacteriophage Mu, GemA protein
MGRRRGRPGPQLLEDLREQNRLGAAARRSAAGYRRRPGPAHRGAHLSRYLGGCYVYWSVGSKRDEPEGRSVNDTELQGPDRGVHAPPDATCLRHGPLPGPPAARDLMALSRRKLALVHLAKSHCRLSEPEYRELLAAAAEVKSARDLDDDGFGRVMDAFAARGFVSSRRGFGERAGMATPGQVTLIRALWQKWSGSEDSRGLNAWLRRSFGVSALRFANRATASKAIDGLKAMLKRRRMPAPKPPVDGPSP